jgi:hypothetical protein
MPAALFYPYTGVRCQPVVRVDDIKAADVVLRMEERVHKRTAHIVNLFYKVLMRGIRAAVIMDAMDILVP